MKTVFGAILAGAMGLLALAGEEGQQKGFPEARNAAMKAEETARAFKLPPDFSVTVFAAEPDVVQPIAFTFDDRGRLWVAEMHSYPTWKPEGKDRILIFEDKDGDGRFDARKVFYDRLNCVSGLEVGFGGVWVGSNPHFLFIPDKDADDVPDGPPEVLLDGWGHQDMHELLNSFTWGPDGWLYGVHGIYTSSRVGKPGTPDAGRTPLNGAVWRYHPTRRTFEIFSEGTSNPWGIDFNDHGQAFITACVIPHLYHVIQGARYQRQSGNHFNPHTYDDIKTIADHRHYGGAKWQDSRSRTDEHDQAGGGHAHAGAMIYLADALPPSYRNTLFMCNIHGNRVNNDLLARKGSGFVGKHGADFLLSADEWFRGLSVKAGPDGAVYLSDWYDKYACHQQKPQDRSNGRIYKITYRGAKPASPDLAKLPSAELVKLQLHANDWFVRKARRLLQERGPNPDVHRALLEILHGNPDVTRRLRALWALHATGGLNSEVAEGCLSVREEYLRAWTVQLLAEGGSSHPTFAAMAKNDPSPVVRLYLAAALQRVPAADRWAALEGLVARAEDADDPNLPLMYWYAAEPAIPTDLARAALLLGKTKIPKLREYIARRLATK